MNYQGYIIYRERVRRNWSQAGLCKGICTVSYLSKIESGRAEPSEEILRLLLARLNLETNREIEREAAGLILKTAPDRIHTLVPGLMVLVHIIKAFDADELVVSRYGVREGYLCQMLQTPAAPIRRTGN